MIKKYESFVIDSKSLPNNNLLETIKNPNFSIVVPGGCNGDCGFCFWKDDKPCGNYIGKLRETLNNMPSQFHQLSLTGGEPTLSPYFSDILESIDTEKWTNRVLTTNGVNLKQYIPQLEGKIQHINISRHHFDDKINESIFNTDSVPSKDELKDVIQELNNVGIDVTYSVVLTEHLSSKDDVKRYIKFAKSHGVDQVFFRKQHGTLDPSDAEKSFEKIDSQDHDCPVCRNTSQVINETNVVWKASLEEPSTELGMIYEMVYNQNGVLTSDWQQEFIVESNQIKDNSESLLESCGGGGYSGCGSSGAGSRRSKEDYGPTDEEIRIAKLRLRDKKINKVIKKVKKQLSEKEEEIEIEPESGTPDSNISSSDGSVDINYTITDD